MFLHNAFSSLIKRKNNNKECAACMRTLCHLDLIIFPMRCKLYLNVSISIHKDRNVSNEMTRASARTLPAHGYKFLIVYVPRYLVIS